MLWKGEKKKYEENKSNFEGSYHGNGLAGTAKIWNELYLQLHFLTSQLMKWPSLCGATIKNALLVAF